MQAFTRFFIHRPIFASVLSILIVVLGLLGLRTLPVAQYPEIAPPSVSIRASYPGANATVLSETVATPIEQEINGVEDMLYLSSQSSNDGTLQISVIFKPGTDLDKAQIQVQNRVALAEPKLPEEVRRLGLVIRKRSPDLSLVINLRSPNGGYDNVYMTNYALLHIKDALARLPGVGEVALFGAKEYSMRVWLDPDRLAARSLTAADVVDAIREQNVQVASGAIAAPPTEGHPDFQLTVTTQGRLEDPKEFADIILTTGSEGQLTRLGDVARLEIGSKDYGSELFLDGARSVGLAIFQLPGSNALETKAAVLTTMDRLRQRFPEGLDYLVSYDTVVFVDESIRKVLETLCEAILLVVLVVLLFLKTWRASLIPLIAVPVSLIGTFGVIALLDLSLNTLSLFGLVLSIGIVVDDAIVVVENVERNMALGLDAESATHRALEEVTGPILATALVLTAVFVPTTFLKGVSGAFYTQFALTISVSTLISAFNSLTLSPALCARLLRTRPTPMKSHSAIGAMLLRFDRLFDRLSRLHALGVGQVLSRPRATSLAFLALIALTFGLFKGIPTGFIPAQDMGYLIVYAQLPDAASLERTEAVIHAASDIIEATPGVAHVNAYSGFSILANGMQSNTGTLFTRLTSPTERAGIPAQQADALVEQLQQRLAQIDGAFLAVFAPPPVRGLSTVGGFKLQIQDRSHLGPEALEAVTRDIITKASSLPGLSRVFTTFRAGVPQLKIEVDRAMTKTLEVPLSQVFKTLQIFLGSLYVNDFNWLGRTYQVFAQAEAHSRSQPEVIPQLKTRNLHGEMVPLGALLRVEESTGPDRIPHYNLFPSAEINGITHRDLSSGEAIAQMSQLMEQELPQTFDYEWTEVSLQEILAGNTALVIFPLSVLFVFLALAAQYESWSLPLAVILTVPIAILSALVGIWLRDMDNNIFTQIGLIVLVGLASKNAILIVEFARRSELEGLPILTAAKRAASLRLRPIVMTSVAFILGVFPLVISTGAGSEARQILGTAVFSGMMGVTVIGLLVTPFLYVAIRNMRLPPSRGPSAGTNA